MRSRLRLLVIPIVLAMFAILSSATNAAVRVVFPTGTLADLGRLQTAINNASSGDTLILKFRSAGGVVKRFNLANVPSGGIVVNVEGLNIVGEIDTRNVRIATRLVGPTTYNASGSFVAFDVQAEDVHMELLKFENFEAAAVLEAGVSAFTMDRCNVSSCAHGVFGVGNNDDVTIRRVKFDLVATPEGGNAGVTLQEGSDRVTISRCSFDGPGTDRAPLAATGVIDFNLQTPARRLTVNECDVKQMDIGIYVSSKRARILQNLSQQCIDGIALVSEIGSGQVQGTQQARECLIMGNRSFANSGQGVHLFGAQSLVVKNNLLAPNTGMGVKCDDSSLGTSSQDNVIERNVGAVDCGSAGITANVPQQGGIARVRPVRP